MRTFRVYAVGSNASDRYCSQYSEEDYAFDATHLADAKLWKNRVEATHAMWEMEKLGACPEGCDVIRFDCTQIVL